MRDAAFGTAICPMTRTMSVVGGKWKPILVFTLGEKRLRFGELARRVELISRKVLTEQLKELEEDAIIIREAFAELPPRVEYRLSSHGLKLLPILEQLAEWHCPTAPKSANGEQ